MRMNVGRLGECNGMLIKIDMHHFGLGVGGILGTIIIIIIIIIIVVTVTTNSGA